LRHSVEMKQDYTDITVLLDRSGSMAAIASDTVGGFNAFVKDQASEPGECRLTLIQFDSQDFQQVDFCAIPIAEVVPLSKNTFSPRSSTPLLDALGEAIDNTGRRLAEMAEDRRPSRVVFVVITDGLENASRLRTRDQIFHMIRDQEEIYKWDFIYLGANQDAIAEAGGIGIGSDKALTYVADSARVESMFMSASRVVRDVRAKKEAAFSKADRDLQEVEVPDSGSSHSK
jgi:hypothetical protein